MKTTNEMIELISSLIDGESETPEADAAEIRRDPLLEKRQWEYQRIGSLMRLRAAPAPSDDFVSGVLTAVRPKNQRNIMRLALSLAAAAVLLMATAVGIYQILPETPLEPAHHSANTPTTSSLIHLDVPETTLASIQIESIDNNELEKTMALFEVIPEETLLIALAELVTEEETLYNATTGGATMLSPWDEKAFETPYLLVDIYMEMKTLEKDEAAAFNEMLRGALAAT